MSDKWLFTEQDIENSPSRADGISRAQEDTLRRAGATHITTIGLNLFDKQKEVVATALLLYNRFFIRRSFKDYDKYIVGTACLWLAGKIEDSIRSIDDVVKRHIRARSTTPIPRDSEMYRSISERVLSAEMQVLNVCEYDMCMTHPWTLAKDIVKQLGLSKQETTVANRVINDVVKSTTLCLEYTPQQVAEAAVCFAARFNKVQLPQTDDPDGKFKAWRNVIQLSDERLNHFKERFEALHRAPPTSQSRSAASSPKNTTTSKNLSAKQHSNVASTISETHVGGNVSSSQPATDTVMTSESVTRFTIQQTTSEPTTESTDTVMSSESTIRSADTAMSSEPTTRSTDTVISSEPTTRSTNQQAILETTTRSTDTVMSSEPTTECTNQQLASEPTTEATVQQLTESAQQYNAKKQNGITSVPKHSSETSEQAALSPSLKHSITTPSSTTQEPMKSNCGTNTVSQHVGVENSLPCPSTVSSAGTHHSNISQSVTPTQSVMVHPIPINTAQPEKHRQQQQEQQQRQDTSTINNTSQPQEQQQRQDTLTINNISQPQEQQQRQDTLTTNGTSQPEHQQQQRQDTLIMNTSQPEHQQQQQRQDTLTMNTSQPQGQQYVNASGTIPQNPNN